MVLGNAGQTVFFTSADCIGLSADAQEMLADEGLGTAEDLKLGTKEFWDNFFVTMAKAKLQEVQNNAGTCHQVPRPHITAALQENFARRQSQSCFTIKLDGHFRSIFSPWE